MDNEGSWRAPEEWPEDYPPLPGWIRNDDGTWGSPPLSQLGDLGVELGLDDLLDLDVDLPTVVVEPTPRRSRQAETDIRSMLLLAGAVAAVMVLLVVALVLITQAGAADDGTSSSGSGVIFAPETEADVLARRVAVAADAPALARTQLDQLTPVIPIPDEAPPFEAELWNAPDDGCLTNDEIVLIRRSQSRVGFADQIDCVPATGRWLDRYQGTMIRRTIDAEISRIVPAPEAYLSGGWSWTLETREAFLTDVEHPASLQVIAAGSGHNPRGLSPADWKPAEPRTWCAYAVDWIAIKGRWRLGVTDPERRALGEMLDSCADPTSDGADPNTVTLDPLIAPEIELLGD